MLTSTTGAARRILSARCATARSSCSAVASSAGSRGWQAANDGDSHHTTIFGALVIFLGTAGCCGCSQLPSYLAWCHDSAALSRLETNGEGHDAPVAIASKVSGRIVATLRSLLAASEFSDKCLA
jgi:hypothetical protein